MKKIILILASLFFMISAGSAVMVIADPQVVSAATSCNKGFLGFPAWYEGVTDGSCAIMSPSDYPGGLGGFIWRIIVNIIDIGLVAVGYVSLGYILYGGLNLIKGMTGVAPGSPEIAANSRKMILNACVGLVIAIASVAIIRLVFGAF